VDRLRIPGFLRDLDAAPGAVRTLAVASLSLFAAGLNPRVFSPGLGSVQAAIRDNSETELLLLVATVVGGALLLIGGVLGDADGRRQLLTGALATMLVTAALGLVVTDGPLFGVSRIVGLAAASVTLPIALAGVAETYEGIPRATALGIAYAVYGAATAAGPILLTLFGPGGSTWPAFAAAALASAITLAVARTAWRDLPVPARGDRRAIGATATWAFGVVLLATGIIGSRTDQDNLLRPILVAAGVAILVLGVVLERRRPHPPTIASRVDRRAVSVALFVGFVVGYAQTAPLLQLPIFFQVVLGYGPILAVVATIPFMAALVVSGPVAGVLIGRFQPRTIVVSGVAAIGAGNVLAALVLGPRTPYIGFGVALLLIGAGFVIATTVRTAIIFASVPRGLPATAAALNEVSVSMGTRAALVLITTFVAGHATELYGQSLAGHPPSEVDAALAAFHDFLVAIGLPGFSTLLASLPDAQAAAYGSAYTEAVRIALLTSGVGALVASVIAGLALGPRDPLQSVWELQDERPAATPPPTASGVSLAQPPPTSRSRRQPKRSMIR
jgi:DHA2 family methylenomycin A resistance protein-like MFS transporter